MRGTLGQLAIAGATPLEMSMASGGTEVSWKSVVKEKAPFAWRAYRSMRFGAHAAKGMAKWFGDGFTVPAPTIVKRAVVRRNAIAGGTFVETGTYLGDATSFARKFSMQVISLEPDRRLFDLATLRFRGANDVRLLNATSEQAFASLLPELNGNVTFWLDAHHSGEGTFLGGSITPIELELTCIREHLGRFRSCVIMVDDVRGFGVASGYPPLSEIVRWADENGMKWHIEHDIFVMGKSPQN